jgi:hypothetical protein
LEGEVNMAKKGKVKWVVVLGAAAGIMLGASQLGYNLIAHNLVSIAAGLLAVAMLYLYAYPKKQLDWTITVGSLVYIAHYLIPVGYVYANYDIHGSAMISAGIIGLILLFTRADLQNI